MSDKTTTEDPVQDPVEDIPPAEPVVDDALPAFPLGDFLRESADAAGETAPCLESLLSDLLSLYQRIAALPEGGRLLAGLFGSPFGRVAPAGPEIARLGSATVESVKARRDDFGLITWADMVSILAQIKVARMEAAAAAQPFRWLGRGVLSVPNGGGFSGEPRTTVKKGDIVSDPAHLSALGEKRIAELIHSGQAELVPAVEEEAK